MAEAGDAQKISCPVITSWQSSQIVMGRMLGGKLVFLPADAGKFKREHLGENVELLAPLIDQLGSLDEVVILAPSCYPVMHCSTAGLRPSVGLIAEYFQRFFMGCRPVTMRMPTRYQPEVKSLTWRLGMITCVEYDCNEVRRS